MRNYRIIVSSAGPIDLSYEVSKWLEESWLPIGGVTVSPSGALYQAIYLPETVAKSVKK